MSAFKVLLMEILNISGILREILRTEDVGSYSFHTGFMIEENKE